MNKKLIYLFVALFPMFVLTSCFDEEEEPDACDTTQIIADLEAAGDELSNLDPNATCEESKSASQEFLDFYNSNKSCINNAIDASATTPEEAEDAKAELEAAVALLEAALLFPC